MRNGPDHLPVHKQRELERIVEMLFGDFREATQNATGRKKSARILKIILFGSYARNDWVDAPFDANRYTSDFDLLVIVNQKELADRATYWSAAEQHLVDAYLFEKTIRTPVNFIVHSLQEVNDALAHGRVFFMELARDGVILYESDDRELAKPQPKTPEQALGAAKEYFEDYYPSAAGTLDTANYVMGKGRLKEAAFHLHQATERLYQCLLLTLTFYTPYDHNVAFLRSQAERLHPELFDIWPRSTRKERAMFQKLKDAYVKARYSRHYRISREELDWLAARITELGQAVHKICQAHINSLERSAGDRAPAPRSHQ